MLPPSTRACGASKIAFLPLANAYHGVCHTTDVYVNTHAGAIYRVKHCILYTFWGAVLDPPFCSDQVQMASRHEDDTKIRVILGSVVAQSLASSSLLYWAYSPNAGVFRPSYLSMTYEGDQGLDTRLEEDNRWMI